MRNLEQLTHLCRGLGATPEQAKRMAAQLLKRADQLAQERDCKPVEALEHLVKVMISGRRGKVYSEPFQGKDSSKASPSK